jgi:hypothetical protein
MTPTQRIASQEVVIFAQSVLRNRIKLFRCSTGFDCSPVLGIQIRSQIHSSEVRIRLRILPFLTKVLSRLKKCLQNKVLTQNFSKKIIFFQRLKIISLQVSYNLQVTKRQESDTDPLVRGTGSAPQCHGYPTQLFSLYFFAASVIFTRIRILSKLVRIWAYKTSTAREPLGRLHCEPLRLQDEPLSGYVVAVFRIRDISIRIFGSEDCITDPNLDPAPGPALFFSGFQDANKNKFFCSLSFFAYYLL